MIADDTITQDELDEQRHDLHIEEATRTWGFVSDTEDCARCVAQAERSADGSF